MVRVAGLLEQEAAGLGVRSVDGLTPARRSPRSRAGHGAERPPGQAVEARAAPGLAAGGIEIVTIEECSPKELRKLEAVFKRDIYPVLTPLAVGPGQAFPYISGLSLSLGVLAVDRDMAEERFARVKVPEGLDRFVDAGKKLVPLEAVIAHFLPLLFPGMDIAERVLFRVTRDDTPSSPTTPTTCWRPSRSRLRRRRFGDVVGLEVSASASRECASDSSEGLECGRPRLRRRGPPRPVRPHAAVAVDRPEL